jgi:AcrR family transcriptional regulator
VKEDKKRHYDSGKTRRSLTAAAIDLFSKIGYDAATTRGIAKKAGVNESLIQRYFANKFGLFSSVVEECHQKLLGDLPYSPAESVEEELRQYLNFRLDIIKKEKKLYRLVLSRALLDKSVAGKMHNISHNGVPHLVERLAVLQQKGLINKNFSLPNISVLVAGISFSLAVWCHIFGKLEEEKAKEVAKLASQIISKGMTLE